MSWRWPARIPLLLFAAAFLFCCYWILRNDAYQVRDGAHLLTEPHWAYTHLKNGDFGNAFLTFWEVRGWKPILSHFAITPFFFLTDGDARGAFRIYALVMLFFFSWALCRFFMTAGLPRGPALACSAVMLSVGWVLADLYEFRAELVWMTLSLFFSAELIRHIRDKNPRHLRWATALLALAMLVRPVEVTLTLMLPFAAYIIYLAKAQVRRMTATGMFLEGAAVLAVGLYPHFANGDPPEYSRLTQLAIAILFLAYFLARSRSPAYREVQVYWSALLGVCLFWYLPRFATLADWIFMSAIGGGAEISTFGLDYSRFFVVAWIFMAGAVLFVPLLLTAAFFRSVVRHWRQRPTEFFYFAWVALGLLAVASLTKSRDPRYYEFSWLVVFAFGSLSLYAVGAKRVFWMATATILILQSGRIYLLLNPHVPTEKGITNWTRYLTGDVYCRSCPPQTAAEFFQVSDFLKRLNLPSKARITFVQARHRESHSTYGATLVLRARESGAEWVFHEFQSGFNSGKPLEEIMPTPEYWDYIFVRYAKRSPPDADSNRVVSEFLSYIPKGGNYIWLAELKLPPDGIDPAEDVHVFRRIGEGTP